MILNDFIDICICVYILPASKKQIHRAMVLRCCRSLLWLLMTWPCPLRCYGIKAVSWREEPAFSAGRTGGTWWAEGEGHYLNLKSQGIEGVSAKVIWIYCESRILPAFVADSLGDESVDLRQ